MDKKVLDLFSATESRQPARQALAEAVSSATDVALPVDVTGKRGTATNNHPLSQGSFDSLVSRRDFPQFTSTTGVFLKDWHPCAAPLVEALWVAHLFRWLSPEGDRFMDHVALTSSWVWSSATSDPGLSALLEASKASQARRLLELERVKGLTADRTALLVSRCRTELLALGVTFDGTAVRESSLEDLGADSALRALLLVIGGQVEVSGLGVVSSAGALARDLCFRLGGPVLGAEAPLLLNVLEAAKAAEPDLDITDPAVLTRLVEEASLLVSDPVSWFQAGQNREERRRRVMSVPSELLAELISDPRVARGTVQPSDPYYRVLWLFANQDALTRDEQVAFYKDCTQAERVVAIRTGSEAQLYFSELLMASRH
jgi:hypothetical protein